MSLASEESKIVQEMLSKMKKNHELEISFNTSSRGVNYETFSRLVKWMTNSLKTDKTIELDILYEPLRSGKSMKTYRFSLLSLPAINKMMKVNSSRSNDLVLSYILKEYLKGKMKLGCITKNKEEKYDFKEVKCRIRLATEEELSKKIIQEIAQDIVTDDCGQILFRLKNRISAKIGKSYQIDATMVFQGNSLNQLRKSPRNYEIEMEVLNSKEKVSNIGTQIETVNKVLYRTDQMIPLSVKEDVLLKFFDLTESHKRKNPLMKTSSLTIKEALQDITDGYMVTAKLDGERRVIFIVDSKIYFLDSNMNIYSGPELPEKKVAPFNNTIIDGEYAYLADKKCHLYRAFDLLFFKENDKRELFIQQRRQFLNEVMADLFGYKNTFATPSPTDSKSIDNMLKFYKKQMMQNYQYSQKNVGKDRFQIEMKYFLTPLGLGVNEIYSYMKLIWDNQELYPLPLDGIVLSSVSQIYTSQARKIRFPDLKWKPENMNSIDFYITKVVNPKTNLPLIVYNNINEEKTGGTVPYQVIHLHVGRKTMRGEEPVFFQSDKELYIAHLPLQPDKSVRDLEGKIVQNNTVVEFVYDRKTKGLESSKRWVPMRTRYDKTEAVRNSRRKYGNYEDIANRIFETIQNPFNYQHIVGMSDIKTYPQVKQELLGIEKTEQEEEPKAYYQKVTTEALESRSFTSWVKSQLISLCKGLVLDWGVGQGGDVIKYMHANHVKKVIGIDPNAAGLYSANGAISRYQNMKKIFSNAKEMQFIQANPSKPFEDQTKLGNGDNQSLIKEYLLNSKLKYDNVCMFFSFHYNFENKNTLKNALDSLKRLVVKGGKVIMVLFDGELVYNNLKKAKGDLVMEYPTPDGTKTLFQIRQKYPKQPLKKLTTGAAIDIYNAIFMNEGDFQTEYLVPPKFMISEMKKVGFSLEDTKLIEDLYDLTFFQQKFKQEKKASLKERWEQIVNYGSQSNPVIDACHVYNSMFRYYIFQKKN